MTGTIFNIQRFSTHDGPGVRTVVFFQGCPLRCFWCQNPESQPPRPVLMQRKANCVGCGSCAAVCPHNAARLVDGVSTIDRDACTVCGLCAEACAHEGLTVSGYEVSIDEVMDAVLKDRQHYINSGGGVTLSGGEVTMQADFALELLKRCRSKYINTAIETCGFVRQEVLERFIPLTDLFFYDLKAIDREKHIRGTGQDNEIIKQNAKMLAASGRELRIRMPLIPGFNDNREDVLALRSFVEDELGMESSKIELLKYNQLGEVKYERLDRADKPAMKPQSDEYFEYLKSLLA